MDESDKIDNIIFIDGTVDDIFNKGKTVLDNFNIDNAYVKPKHLSTTKGKGQQFLGNTKIGAEEIFKKGKNVLDGFNIDDAYVKPKHLSTSGGKARKFLGDSKIAAEEILKDALTNGKIISITDNGVTKIGKNSYEIIIDAGKTVGTRGETSIKIILSEDGGMLSAYPVN
ncbi:hypothetical protein [uncultured Clostridium sp.]|uniref:hypothetical protein n=1 Tax=uncultured Clostridium sp. TaxID=59620 RepID=UPI0028EBD7BB|nr:hypothetical protein [uncultured Clostridium sp.]